MSGRGFKRVVIVINPGAGKGQELLRPINDVLHPAGITWDARITNGPGEGTTLAREAVDAGADIVGVVGGDGTVAEVALGLANTGVPLAIIPGGTGNGAASEFGIPKSVSEAARLLVEGGTVRAFDIGRTADKGVVLRCACGAIADIDRRATRDMKSHIGGLAYAVAGLGEIASVTPTDYRITCDGTTYEARGITCIVANGAGFGGVGTLADGISTSDGAFDVLVFTGARLTDPTAAVTELLPELVGAKPHAQDPVCSGVDIVVESSAPQPIVADGEDAGSTPMRVEVLAGALRLLVPTSAEPLPGPSLNPR